MEIWIRSQDKMALVRAGDLYVKYVHYTDGFYYTVQNAEFNLGHYKTKERALEVLDEIEDLMRSIQYSELKTFIYKMPKV